MPISYKQSLALFFIYLQNAIEFDVKILYGCRRFHRYIFKFSQIIFFISLKIRLSLILKFYMAVENSVATSSNFLRILENSYTQVTRSNIVVAQDISSYSSRLRGKVSLCQTRIRDISGLGLLQDISGLGFCTGLMAITGPGRAGRNSPRACPPDDRLSATPSLLLCAAYLSYSPSLDPLVGARALARMGGGRKARRGRARALRRNPLPWESSSRAVPTSRLPLRCRRPG